MTPSRSRSIRRLALAAVMLGAAGLATLAVLYAMGLRVVTWGGGRPHLEFERSAEDQAEAIAAHRARQQAEASAARPPAASMDATPPAGAASAGDAGVRAPGESSAGTPGSATAGSRASAPAGPPASTPAGSPASAAAGSPAAAGAAPPPRSAPAIIAPPVPGGPWTDFRGPDRSGRYAARPVRVDWPSNGLTPLWKVPVGEGYASLVTGDGRVYTIEQRGREEVVAAYDPATGRELWTNRWATRFSEQLGGDGPRATPTWADGRVYALGATGEFRVLDDATGTVVWRTNILEDAGAANLPWGMAASPLIVGDAVVVVPGGTDGMGVVAYDRRTGERRWSSLDDRAAYASPMLVSIAGRVQILAVMATRLVGLDPAGGAVLWSFPWRTEFDVNAAQPIVVGANRVFYSSGYGSGAVLVEIAASAGGLEAREVWRSIRMKNQFSSSVLHEGHIYGLDESILACIDAATGELRWKGGRYGYGQVVYASGHLIVATEDGDVALVRATPERHDEVVRFGALSGKTWNVPSFADGILLVRNLREMVAFDLRR
ncbi:MAG: PQQ-binding-like beta-propeller repeat protein [Vicinamibacterales bacterium]